MGGVSVQSNPGHLGEGKGPLCPIFGDRRGIEAADLDSPNHNQCQSRTARPCHSRGVYKKDRARRAVVLPYRLLRASGHLWAISFSVQVKAMSLGSCSPRWLLPVGLWARHPPSQAPQAHRASQHRRGFPKSTLPSETWLQTLK